jgi:hypothetical protein
MIKDVEINDAVLKLILRSHISISDIIAVFWFIFFSSIKIVVVRGKKNRVCLKT